MNTTLLELQNAVVLRHTEPAGFFGLWGAKPVRAVDGVSLALRRGETLGLMGGSGAGKTTLAEAATLRRLPDRGKVILEGNDVSKVKGGERTRLLRRLQMIRQDARESLDMDRTVRKQLVDRLQQAGIPDGEARVRRALVQVELGDEFLGRTPGEMSGGQQQRLAIARALMTGPVLVAADEPVSGVDPRLQREMLAMMERVQREQNLTYLLISHDRRTIRRLAHRVAVMDAGRLYEVGPSDAVFGEAKHPYSRVFLGPADGAMPPEEDMVGRVIAGCPWARSCPLATERCRTAAPVLREVAADHLVACHEV
ncbi:MAG TPA: ATP-binding cassette domain-containing protein [Symbiobacteriaceae bacterium]|nr:ATP-binding cassette domain-containing protein [Symbiobacteriaceae bacterium]